MKRGRISAADIATPCPTGEPSRLTPPAGLLSAERTAFTELVASVHPAHFRQSDVGLVVSYIQATILAHKLGRKPDKAREWEVVVRAQASLAVKLRLAPSARTDPKVIARQMPDNFPKPWLQYADDDDEEVRHDH
jgi:hypothetical protein